MDIKTKILIFLKNYNIQRIQKNSDEIYSFTNKTSNEIMFFPNLKEQIMEDCCIDSFYSKEVDEILKDILEKKKGFI